MEETCLLWQSWGNCTVAAPASLSPVFPINTGRAQENRGRERAKKMNREKEEKSKIGIERREPREKRRRRRRRREKIEKKQGKKW
jgi:hypothetical protein